MGDKYTVYPDQVKKRIDAVDKFMEDIPRYRAWWDSLPEEEKARLEALPPDERQKEVVRLRANPGNPNPPAEDNPNNDNPPAEDSIESLKAELEKTRQKYRTLQGMIKEPAELEKQNNVLLTQIKMLQDKLYDVEKKEKEAVAAKPPAPKINVREALKTHYDKLSETLAPDIVEQEIQKDERLFELFESRANQRISEVIAEVDGKFKLTAEQQFYKDLNEWGDWKKMWATPEFQAFLGEEADVTGVERYAIIQDAFARLDSRIVLRAFDKFTGKGPAPSRNAPLDDSKMKNRVAAPRSSSSASAPRQDQNKNSISPQEARKALANLAADYSRGMFKGNKEEYDRKYAELFNIVHGGTG